MLRNRVSALTSRLNRRVISDNSSNQLGAIMVRYRKLTGYICKNSVGQQELFLRKAVAAISKAFG